MEQLERITIKCPKCGNRMDIDPKVIAFRCSKCGEKIDLDEEPVKQSAVMANINVDRREVVKMDKADFLRAKNEYKLEKKRLRQENRGSGSLFNRKEKPEVVYRDRPVGFGAALVGIAKWFAILLMAAGVLMELERAFMLLSRK